MNIYWCLTHSSNAEGPVVRCFYALWSDATDRCELADAEIKLSKSDDDPKLFTDMEEIPLPTVEEWVNLRGGW